MPGVIPSPSTESTASDSLFINGQDDNNNGFFMDGANNDDDVIGARAGAQARTPMEAIQVSTLESARLLKMDDRIGSIEEGKLADLVVVDGDPLQDIGLLRDKARIAWVIQDGDVIMRRAGNAILRPRESAILAGAAA